MIQKNLSHKGIANYGEEARKLLFKYLDVKDKYDKALYKGVWGVALKGAVSIFIMYASSIVLKGNSETVTYLNHAVSATLFLMLAWSVLDIVKTKVWKILKYRSKAIQLKHKFLYSFGIDVSHLTDDNLLDGLYFDDIESIKKRSSYGVFENTRTSV